jgi:putative FmdB family regulatory protein
MPIYDYVCDKCSAQVKDLLKKMSDPAPQHCEQEMRQLFQTKIEVFDTTQVFEHCALTPMQFRSKRELRNYCRANDMTSHLAE